MAGPLKHYTKTCINVVACDAHGKTGEASLAKSIMLALEERGATIDLYTPNRTTWITNTAVFKRRLAHFYGFFVAAFLALFSRKKTIYVNYVPLWNPLVAILARLGVVLGPLTGSVGITPLEPTWRDQFLRGFLQRKLALFTLWLLPKRRYYWAATPSVYEVMRFNGFENVGRGFPFYLTENFVSKTNRDYKDITTNSFFIYCKNHPLKNWKFTNKVAQHLCKLGFRVTLIGHANFDHKNLHNLNMVTEDEFNSHILSSECFLCLTSEDAGIACMTADLYRKPIIYLSRTAAQHISDPCRSKDLEYDKDVVKFSQKIIEIYDNIKSKSGQSNKKSKENINLTQNAYARWLEAIL